MLNIDAFLKRLEQLMENHQLNAAAFAEKIGVQRSSVSHILSRRNKPSLEFILKVQAEFTEADFDWLLLGARKKSSPTSNQLLVDQGKVDELEADKSINPPQKSISTSLDVFDTEVLQIIQTYKDGTFRVFLPKS
jgi:transcriptional regulator with XRE-family HTH domain